ncbi:MAG: glycosyltransferase family protein [Candidatus Nitrospinota bacterium M3_3B_026]
MTNINEIEYDIQKMFAKMAGYDLKIAVPSANNNYFFPVDVDIAYTNMISEQMITRALREYAPDIMVHRYRQPIDPILDSAMSTNTRVLVWVTEQGPERNTEIQRALNFHNVIVNNEADYKSYRRAGVENVYYMPFCCVPEVHRRVKAPAKYRTDVVCYGNPLYKRYKSKRQAIDTLVKPLIEKNHDISLWGMAKGYGGWLEIPYVKDRVHYRGVFPYEDLPKVNSGAKIVLGITANAEYGAYGSRLARALGCGSFVIWHYTKGMENYFENHKQLCWSSSPEETLELVRYYLKHDREREKIAKEGQRYAYEHLNYKKRLIPIIEDVLSQGEVKNASRWYQKLAAFRESYIFGDYGEALSRGERILSNGGAPRGIESEIYFYMGNIRFQRGETEAAVNLYSKATRKSKRPELYNNKGVAMLHLGEHEKAKRLISSALKQRAGYKDADFNLMFLRLNPGAKLNLKLTHRLIRE